MTKKKIETAEITENVNTAADEEAPRIEMEIELASGDIIQLSFKSMKAAYHFCKDSIVFFGDCQNARIDYNGITVYKYTLIGETFYIIWWHGMKEVSEKTFKTLYNIA